MIIFPYWCLISTLMWTSWACSWLVEFNEISKWALLHCCHDLIFHFDASWYWRLAIIKIKYALFESKVDLAKCRHSSSFYYDYGWKVIYLYSYWKYENMLLLLRFHLSFHWEFLETCFVKSTWITLILFTWNDYL